MCFVFISSSGFHSGVVERGVRSSLEVNCIYTQTGHFFGLENALSKELDSIWMYVYNCTSITSLNIVSTEVYIRLTLRTIFRYLHLTQ